MSVLQGNPAYGISGMLRPSENSGSLQFGNGSTEEQTDSLHEYAVIADL